MSLNVVVLGGGGFIGAHAAHALVDAGCDVSVSLRAGGHPWRLDALGINPRRVQMQQIDWSAVDLVLVAAGFGSPQPFNPDSLEAWGAEIAFHRQLLRAIAQVKADPLIIACGSRTQYGITNGQPIHEDAVRSPTSLYALEKDAIDRMYELASQQAGIRSVRLRITNPFGPLEWVPHRSHGLVSQFLVQAIRDRRITVYGSGESVRDYVAIADLTRLIVTVAQAQPGGSTALNAGSGTPTTILSLANHIVHQLHEHGVTADQATVELIPFPVGSAQVETGGFVASIERAADIFGWSPRHSLQTMLPEVVATEAPRIRAALHPGVSLF